MPGRGLAAGADWVSVTSLELVKPETSVSLRVSNITTKALARLGLSIFEADFDTLNMDAIHAMDTIEGLGANLVWITPKVREELQQKDQPA